MITPQRRGAFAVVPLVLPALAVAVMAVSVQVWGRPRAVVGVRLRGGPTPGQGPVAVRLEVVERLRDQERPVVGRPVSVEAGRPSEPNQWHGTLDDEGSAAVQLPPEARSPDGSVRARIQVGGAPPTEARWSLSVEHWARRARQRGGWVERRFDDGVVRAALERGVLAVPFPGALWVEAERAGTFVSRVDATGDGADISVPASLGHGRLRFTVTPREHAASVALRIPGAPGAELDVSLAIVPGALLAELDGDALVVRAPIARDRAYVAVVTRRERVAGGTVVLAPDGRGGARGALEGLTLPEREPLWAVVSSEPELASPSLVGWPIRYDADGPPPTTFDVPDALLFDGVGDAVARENARVRAVRAVTAAIAVLAFAVTAVMVALRARRSRAALTEHLKEGGADDDVRAAVTGTGGGSAWLVVAAVLAILLAAVLAAIFVVAR